MTDYAPNRTFKPHRRAAYAEQRASCGCYWSAITGHRHTGEHCESRLTGPRCGKVLGCNRPREHAGDCEIGKAPRYEWPAARPGSAGL